MVMDVGAAPTGMGLPAVLVTKLIGVNGVCVVVAYVGGQAVGSDGDGIGPGAHRYGVTRCVRREVDGGDEAREQLFVVPSSVT